MKAYDIDPLTKELFDNVVKSLESESEDQVIQARRAWFTKYPMFGDGAPSGIKVIDENDIASRSGQLTLAALMATECGARPATLNEIKNALVFWAGSDELFAVKYNHYSYYMCEKMGWATYKSGSLTLATGVKKTEEALRVVDAFRRRRISEELSLPVSEGDTSIASEDDQPLQRANNPAAEECVPTGEFLVGSDLIYQDIAEIYQLDIPETEREAIVKSRLGQGEFREEVLKLWDGCCAVTGSGVVEAIRASHIKSWSDFPNERLDPRNGLPLIATLDALFDRGLITFDSAGMMLISSRLGENERSVLGLSGLRLKGNLHPRTQEHLSFHSNNHFQR